MTDARRLTRRDFLRLRRSERGKVLEVSCRALFMRLADATIEPERLEHYESWMGEPPAIFDRASPVEIVQSLDADLRDVQVLRLLEPEWLEGIQEAVRIQSTLDAFRSRGGVVEEAS
jgi:hypothetical protein